MHDDALKRLKTAFCGAPDCDAPNFQTPFTIFTDAYNLVVGACIAQIDDDAIER